MAAIEKKITALEAKIEMYEQEYVNASPGVKKELRAVIIAKEGRLTALYQQQLQQQQGEFVPVTSTSRL